MARTIVSNRRHANGIVYIVFKAVWQRQQSKKYYHTRDTRANVFLKEL